MREQRAMGAVLHGGEKMLCELTFDHGAKKKHGARNGDVQRKIIKCEMLLRHSSGPQESGQMYESRRSAERPYLRQIFKYNQICHETRWDHLGSQSGEKEETKN